MSNKTSKLVVVALAIGAYFSLPPHALPPAMAGSEPVASTAVVDEQIDNKTYQVCKVLVKAKPEHVWQILTDYSAAPGIFPTLKKCQVLSDKGGSKVIRYQIKPSGLMTSFEYDLEVHETAPKHMEWKRIAGDFKEVVGYWKLEPVDCGRSTLVTYASYVNGGLFLPQALIKRQYRIDLPQIMTALKGHAETTTQIASRAQHSSN